MIRACRRTTVLALALCVGVAQLPARASGTAFASQHQSPAMTAPSAWTTLVTFCDLTIQKNIGSSLGGQPIIILTVSNAGTGACPAGTNVVDAQPTGLTFVPPVSANQSGWSCGFAAASNDLTCTTQAPLPAGYSATFTFAFAAIGAPGTSIQNCAAVTNSSDANSSNDESCIHIQVPPLPTSTTTATRTQPPTSTRPGTATPTRTPTPCCPDPTSTVKIDTGPTPGTTPGSSDPNWSLIAAPAGTTGVPPPPPARPATVVAPNAAWSTLPGTQWISANLACSTTFTTSCPFGVYSYELCWNQCVNGGGTLDLYADNTAAVYLNGGLIGSTPAAGFNGSATSIAFSTTAGTNCLRVDVTNNTTSPSGMDATLALTGCAMVLPPMSPPSPTPTGSPTPTRTATLSNTPTMIPTAAATPTRTVPPSPTPSRAAPTSTSTPPQVSTSTSTPVPATTPLATPTPTTGCAPVPTGLVAWYPLDEHAGATTVADISGHGHYGTPQPGAVSATASGGGPAANFPTPPAVVGGSLYFYAPQVYVQVPNSTALDIGTGDFTIDAWVYPVTETASPNFVQPIVDKFDGHAHAGYKLYIDNPLIPTNAGLYLSYGDGTFSSTVQSTASIAYQQWHHVAVTVQRNATTPFLQVLFYVDGTPQGGQSVITPVGSISNGLDLLIGGNRETIAGAVAFGEIAIDELEIFNTALTAADIAALFNAGSFGKCRPPRCVGDCDGSNNVTMDELLSMVNIGLGNADVSTCVAGQAEYNGPVTVDAILTAVNHARSGCGALQEIP